MDQNTGKIVIGKADALVVVDMQNDFAQPEGALYVAGVDGEVNGGQLIVNILALSKERFGAIVTTEDYHPVGHIEESIFPPHCVRGTDGQKYVPDLDEIYCIAAEHVIKGGQVSIIAYSVATSDEFPKHIANLRSWGIKRLFLTGLAYTHCVGESAIAYASQGFEVYVIRDATRSVPPPYGNPEQMKQKLALYDVKEITMADIE